MIEWLPQVCSELHGEMVRVYWMMLLPLIAFLTILEFFKSGNQWPDAGRILFRALVSILMLISFKETINLIAFVGDGIAERIDGLAKMSQIMEVFGDNFLRDAPALYKIRELFIFLLNFLSYFLAYFGIFIVEALIHFSWSVLYVCAPLMILCYVPEQTANVSKNLYKGLLTVISWKILWSILGVLLLKLAVQQTTENSENVISTAVINLCIAFSILLVPLFSRSLLGDGLSGFTAGIAGVAGMTALKAGKAVVGMPVAKAGNWTKGKVRSGWKAVSGDSKKENELQVKKKNRTQRRFK